MRSDALIAAHGDANVLVIDGDDLIALPADEISDRTGALVAGIVRMLGDSLAIEGFAIREWVDTRTLVLDFAEGPHETPLPVGETLDVPAIVAVFARFVGAGRLTVEGIEDQGLAVVFTGGTRPK